MSRRDVWTPIAGVLAAVTFVVGLIFASDSPGSNDTDAQVVAWYEDHSHRVGILVGAFVLAFCGLFFLWFASGLRERLRVADGGGERVGSVAFAGGILFVAMLWVGAAALAAIPASQSFGNNPALKVADIGRVVPSLGFGAILVFAAFGAIALIGATSIVSIRTGILPAWFAWLGFVAMVALLFGVVFIPMIALPIWLIAASVILFRSGPEVESVPR
jgi:hypothetical protein